MTLADLKKQFIVDETAVKADLEELIKKALPFCVIDNTGRVHVKDLSLPGKARAQLVLTARLLAHELEDSISPELSTEEIASASGLPANQARARLSQLADEHFVEPGERGKYRANLVRVRKFLDELGTKGAK